MMKHTLAVLLILSSLLSVAACTSNQKDGSNYPMDPESRRRERLGKLSGEEGLVLFNSKKSDDETSSAGASGIGVNSYIWRASLDTLSFLPLVSADPFGGVILTDWYEDSEHRGERFKINAMILSTNLTANAVKLTVFKQVQQKNGAWQDTKTTGDLARTLEDKILTRARELRVAQEKK